jgi:hypothetical protein
VTLPTIPKDNFKITTAASFFPLSLQGLQNFNSEKIISYVVIITAHQEGLPPENKRSSCSGTTLDLQKGKC